jgi:ligand-binding SRPBCC domain-containing protein
MAIYCKKTAQKLPISLEEAWDFLSSPYNLKTITPEHMGFKIKNDVKEGDKMFAGQIIVYDITPLPGYKAEWVTEITHVENLKYFIDEQRFGPYALWHHRHELVAIEGGVLMNDTIHYKVPFGILGRIANSIFIRKQLEGIFSFREQKLESMFGKYRG